MGAKIIDMTGKVCGRLTVLERAENDKHQNSRWLCRCECGNLTITRSSDLRSGRIKSCGCLTKETARKIHTKTDLTNQRFGRLLALEPVVVNNSPKWKCKCDCGTITYVFRANLLQGKTLSCGCLNSKGEEKISQILSENNLSFVRQKTFENCISPNHWKLKFDFYVEDSFLIEFDGVQHFKMNNGWNNKNHFKQLKQNDSIKNQFCKENNILLKRIPYWDLENLNIEDLLGDKYNYDECEEK